MTTSSSRLNAAKAATALAAAASLASLLVSAPSPAGADPRPFFVGVGSDTTQDVMNALGGVSLASPSPAPLISGGKVIHSYDAIVGGTTGTCITPKAPGATFDRPNGSTNGRRALSRAMGIPTTTGSGTLWKVTGSTCPNPGGTLVSGLIDFARSSAGPASGSGPGPLMYLPLGRDALSFAYASVGVTTPVTSLTSAQLNTIFTSTTPQVINGVEIVPCSIQSGSGTYQSWNTAVGASAAQMLASTATCRAAGPTPPGEIQENDGIGLRNRADSFVGKQVIIGFSAANFIAQSNGVVASQLPVGGGVDLGEIVVPAGNLGKPYTGTGSSLAPSATFYANTTFGRTVYNVVQGSKITGAGNNDLKLMFARTALGIPQVCSAAAQVTVNAYGFASLPAGPGAGTCGDTSLTGPSIDTDGTL